MADNLTITSREGLGIAGVAARKGVDPAAIGAALWIDAPSGPHATITAARTMLGVGPDAWLLVEDDAAPDFADTLAATLAGIASVSDQSSGYLVRRLSGERARTVLQRGAAIDFHPGAFAAGSAAATVIAHIGVLIWQVDDRPTYDVAIPRSYAASFGHWLDLTVAAL